MATITDPTSCGVAAKEIPAICDTKFLRGFLSVSPWTLGEWLASGYFPPPDLRLGRRMTWYRKTVTRWLEQQETKR